MTKRLTEKVGGMVSVRTIQGKPVGWHILFGMFFATNDPDIFPEHEMDDAIKRRVVVDNVTTRFWETKEKATMLQRIFGMAVSE